MSIDSTPMASCTYCVSSFPEVAITRFVDDGRTPVCPLCGIDAVYRGACSRAELLRDHRDLHCPEFRLLCGPPEEWSGPPPNAEALAESLADPSELEVVQTARSVFDALCGPSLDAYSQDTIDETLLLSVVIPHLPKGVEPERGHHDGPGLALKDQGFDASSVMGARVLAGYAGESLERRWRRIHSTFETYRLAAAARVIAGVRHGVVSTEVAFARRMLIQVPSNVDNPPACCFGRPDLRAALLDALDRSLSHPTPNAEAPHV